MGTLAGMAAAVFPIAANALLSLRRTIPALRSKFNNKMIEYAKNNQIDLAIGGL
jgi:hypothetical protein